MINSLISNAEQAQINMLKLNDLVPTNLQTEKAKFWASGFTYNPQFAYAAVIEQSELEKYGRPHWWYLWLAKQNLRKYLRQRNDTLKSEPSAKLSQASIEQAIHQRLAFHQLELAYQVVFSPDFVSRIAVNNKTKTIKVRLPVTITAAEIEGTLNHEIDTHILRQINYEQQPWYKKKKKYQLQNHIRTEEGLALINEMLGGDNRLNYKSAANYLAVDLALKHDFVTVFKFFYELWHDADRSWLWTVKKKRGLADTSQPGSYTKDLVYFEGLHQVLRYLHGNNYDPSSLYQGKIACADAARLEAQGENQQQLLLPKLWLEQPDQYRRGVRELVRQNLFLSRF